MEKNASENNKKLRGELLLKGFSISGFARANDYRPNSVVQAIRRHWGKHNRRPPRGKSLEILETLAQTLGLEQIP